MYSRDLVSAVVKYFNSSTISMRAIGKIFGVCKDTVKRWIVSSTSSNTVTKVPTHIKIAHVVKRILDSEPFYRLSDIRRTLSETGIYVSITTIFRSIQYNGMSYKFTQRDDGSTSVRPHTFYTEDHLSGDTIAIDETCFYINDTQRKGWCMKNTRLKTPKMLSRVKMSTMLAIDRRGVVVTETIKGNYNTETFAMFLDKIPANRKLVLDNVAFHKSKAVRDVARTKDITLCFTPPYCPWFNPVEFAFSVAKTCYRRSNVKFHSSSMYEIITKSLLSVSGPCCESFFELATKRVRRSLIENPVLSLA